MSGLNFEIIEIFAKFEPQLKVTILAAQIIENFFEYNCRNNLNLIKYNYQQGLLWK